MNEADKPALLIAIELPEDSLESLRTAFRIHYTPRKALLDKALLGEGAAGRAVLTNGTTGLDRARMDALPALEMISVLGVGFENVDLAAAREKKGLPVSNGHGTNDTTVSDHTMALILAMLRDIPAMDRWVRAGGWRSSASTRPMLTGKSLGVLGLGMIGRQIAKRCAGFDMPVGYHNRKPITGESFTYYASPRELAANSDVLVITTPGGAGTRHLVDAEVLAALGPQGYVVNVARGSVLDTDALLAALDKDLIAGAVLDHLSLPPMVRENRSRFSTAFTVSIEARHGVSTGVSAQDHVRTISAAIAADARTEDLVSSGHVFPLRAVEGSVLARLAGLRPSAVLFELMNPDGSMSRGAQIEVFAERHGLTVLSIDELAENRRRREGA
ncbi:MAG: 3,4-dihydroxy-2-butanone-4-phosphate synthase [Candidatus Protistobacter heckmanni]|nr:3,4-dihydroxy-2-butanone-4-phosphate synthase [Candidatus Protistobacter heckmanni]